VAARDETGIVSTACGVIDRGYLAIESVATVEEARNRGLAGRVVGALMNWAEGAGAKAACLQVAADNLPARALYTRLGFDTELYRYHYRRAGSS
jgi:ribosomal protein S18 acetylase RimI-like enzyme